MSLINNKEFNSGNGNEIENTQCRKNGIRKQVQSIFELVLEIGLLILTLLWYFAEASYRCFIPAPEISMKGEIVLITGAGHGIGKELAVQYASQGATVVCWDINKESNEQTVREIAGFNYPKAYSYTCNVANRNNVMETGEMVQKDVGEVTILINNAGIMPCRPLLDHTSEDIERIINVNVMAHFWTLQAFLPNMIKNNRGHIVGISSGCGLLGLRYLVPYCTSKFAVRGIMEALYQELHTNPKCRIKLTCIYPWMVDTGLCKKPVLRFPNLLPLLKPRDVAKTIMSAQRRGVVETSIPSNQYNGYCFGRIFPAKVNRAVQDFLGFYVDSDL